MAPVIDARSERETKGVALIGLLAPPVIAMVAFAALSRVHTVSRTEVPIWMWLIPWRLQLSGAVLLALGLCGIAWCFVRRSRAGNTAVLAGVVVAAHLELLLTVTDPPSANAWFDFRLANIAETSVVVFEVAVLSWIAQIALQLHALRSRR